MTRKLTATHAGQTFTRTTDRTYTHVIVGRLDLERAVERTRKDAADAMQRNWNYIQRCASDAPTNHDHKDTITECRRLVDLGLEQAIAETAYKAEKLLRDYEANRSPWVALAWVGRPDLVQKQIDYWRKPLHAMAEVLAIPVDA